MMKSLRKLAPIFGVIIFSLACGFAVQAQVTTGNVRGTVTDPNGAVVTNAKVTITKRATNTSTTTQSSGSGEFEFSNLPVGDDYSVTVEAQNFKTLTLTDVKVQLNQVTDLATQLALGAVGEVVTVTAGGTELVDTTTSNLSKSFSARQVSELAQTGAGYSGVNNLALIAPNVTSSGGIGVGTGGSVGGQRPRDNNFMIDGVDNNDKSVTGPQSYVSPEEVAEFSLVQNQFSAEFARSNGGQFITVTKTGTNDFHGAFHVAFRNRYFNALDELQKLAGVTRNRADGDLFMPRSDYFRGGYNLGGPVFFPRLGEGGPSLWKLRDKLFFFTSYERLQSGSAVGSPGIVLPTATGFATLSALPGLSATNLSVLRQFLNLNPARDRSLEACNINVVHDDCPVANRIPFDAGAVNIPSPNFFKQNHAVINLDYNQSQDTQHHWRFLMTNGSDIDTAASLPIFFSPVPLKQRLFSYTINHNFNKNLINETRLAFRRSSNSFPVPDLRFPGLDSFPGIILDDLGITLGPDPNAPQSGIENNYQVVDNVTWIAGSHSFKFGGDFRKLISPQRFVQRERGDYEYLFIDDYLRDFSPEFGERNVGGNTYYGDQKILYAFVQDDWRMRPNVTLNVGVSYSYQEVTKGVKFQAANALASVPGLLEFRAPKTQTRNFGPRIGFAWAPDYTGGMLGRLFGSSGKSSIRAGFSMGYDYIFDNLGILSNPPQAQQTIDVGGTGQPNDCCPSRGFLASGGISPIPVAGAGLTDPVALRQATGSFIPDQEVPYSLTWTGSFQRQFHNDWSFEVRYLGTRGIHLITQNRLNIQAKVSPEDGRSGLPTYITGAPTQAQIDALPAATLTLANIDARSNLVPKYAAAGFDGAAVVAFLSNGNSSYHGASAQVTKRLSNGFQITGAYTWSHLIDDTTAEVFSTVLSPRRVEDFQNLRRERATSGLDHRHRFVVSSIYELPWFKNSNGLTKTLLGGFSISGTYTAESGQRMTIRSGNDANRNGDSAGDRGILNPGGTEGIGSTVRALVRTCTMPDPLDPTECLQSAASRTVGYAANNPAAKYIQTGNGAVSNLGRNTFLLPGINNFDFSIFKKFSVGESKYFQLRADFYNVLNHPQYVPGSVNTVDAVATTGLTTLNQIAPLTSDFLNPSQVLSSNPRVVVLGARFVF